MKYLISASAIITALFVLSVSVSGATSGAKNIKVASDRWPDTSSLQNFGKSSAEIMQSSTDEEKAIALWRMIQQTTDTKYGGSIIAKEPAYGISNILDPIKLLNVYGVHYCDGLSRIMQMTWRSLGKRAEKYYKWGHTMSDIGYREEDGEFRWHLFDLSQHWFTYSRDGKHVASADEIMVDYSLMEFPSKTPIASKGSGWGLWGGVHAVHFQFPTHNTGIDLKLNDSLERLWGNIGKPYFDVWSNLGGKDVEHGPYMRTFGNGIYVFTPDFSSDNCKQSFTSSANLSCGGQKPGSAGIFAKSPGISAEAVYYVRSPYIISDAEFSGNFIRKNPNDSIKVFISNDGETWKQVYDADKLGSFTVKEHNIAESFNVRKKYPPGLITPFGHYEYLVKIELYAHNDVTDSVVQDFSFKTVVQLNQFSLPQLWPGRNKITVEGDLSDDTSLVVTYVWNDLTGPDKRNSVLVTSTPFTYEILTEADVWDDVVVKKITIEAVPRQPGESRVLEQEKPPRSINTISPEDAFDTFSLIGGRYATDLKTVEQYIDDLNNAIAAQEGYQTDSPKVYKRAEAVKLALLGIAAHGSKAYTAKDAVLNAILKDRSSPNNKAFACQTLYQISGVEAVPILQKVLQRDASILWADDSSTSTSANLWINSASAASSVLGYMAMMGINEARTAADDVQLLLDESWVQNKSGLNPEKISRWQERRWGFVRSLGRLGSAKHSAVLTKILEGNFNGDEKEVAAKALGNLKDPSSLNSLKKLLAAHQYAPQGWYAIEGIGRIGSKNDAEILYPFLNHWDENYRGYTAEALGKLGNPDALPELRVLLKNEQFPWVIDAARKSLKDLNLR